MKPMKPMNPMNPYLLTLACAALGMNLAWGQVAVDSKHVVVPKPPVWVEEEERFVPAQHSISVNTSNKVHDWETAVSFDIVKQPAHGTLQIDFYPFDPAKPDEPSFEPIILYTPNEGYLGTDDFTWTFTNAAGSSNVATTSILIREDGDRAGMTVILVVKDTLLPELSAEVNRLKADLDAEGYRAKIKPWSSTNARELYAYLQSEYFSEAQFVAGAIFIGALPTAYKGNPSNNSMTDMVFMDMCQQPSSVSAEWWTPNLPDIWVSRMTAFNLPDGEIKLLRRALQANHDYRTGAHRLPHTVHYGCTAFPYTDNTAIPLPNYGVIDNARILYPSSEIRNFAPVKEKIGAGLGIYAEDWKYKMPYDFPNGTQNDAFRAGGELMDSQAHGDRDSYNNNLVGYQITGDSISYAIPQIRFTIAGSCTSGQLGGAVNLTLLSRGGGNVLSVGATIPTLINTTSGCLFDPGRSGLDILHQLAAGDSWGNGWVRRCFFMERNSLMFYGDLSLGAKMAPSNEIPAISALSASRVSGVAPLTVDFSTQASDADGAVALYEWFAEGSQFGRVEPTHVGPNRTSISHTYTLPYRYLARVEVVDKYKARAWKDVEIIVAPQPGQPLRVNCDDSHRLTANADARLQRPLSAYEYAKNGRFESRDYFDAGGNIWLHDQPHIAGTWGLSEAANGDYVNAAVAGTTDPELFHNFRDHTKIAYRVPVPNGTYQLRLGFADMRSTAAGQRVMDITVQGARVATGVDIFAEAGAKTARTLTYEATVQDGELSFSVDKNSASANNAFLNCFEVIPVALGGANNPPVTLYRSLVTAKDLPTGVLLEATDSDGQQLSYRIVTDPQRGSLSGSESNWIYTPQPGYEGTDSFTFAASDGVTETTGTVAITVSGHPRMVNHWQLSEDSNYRDMVGGNSGSKVGGFIYWQTGQKFGSRAPLLGADSRANNFITTSLRSPAPDHFTVSLWFKPNTTTGGGGHLMGFGKSPSALSSLADRHIYLNNARQLNFGVIHGGVKTVITSAGNFSNTAWHHVAATLSPAGMALYANGVLVASNSAVRSGVPYAGYWKMGGENLAGWPQEPSRFDARTHLQDARVYNYALSAAEVAALQAATVPVVSTSGPTGNSTTAVGGATRRFSVSATGGTGQTLTYSWRVNGNVVQTSTANTFDYTPPVVDSGTNKVEVSVLNSHGLETIKSWSVTTAQGFDYWLGKNGLRGSEAGALANPARDGVSNLLKYALGMCPRTPCNAATDGTKPGLPQVTLEKNPQAGDQLTLQYQKDTSKADVTYRVETSSDLINWTTPAEITETIEATTGTVQTIKAEVPAGSGKKFIRLKVEKMTDQ